MTYKNCGGDIWWYIFSMRWTRNSRTMDTESALTNRTLSFCRFIFKRRFNSIRIWIVIVLYDLVYIMRNPFDYWVPIEFHGNSFCCSLLSWPFYCYTFLYARLKNGRIMPWQCPSVRLSVRPSVRPSVRVFRTFLQHALRYQFETWYIHSVGSTTCRVWVASQLGHFDLVYSQK